MRDEVMLSFGAVLEQRLSRRTLLTGAASMIVTGAAASALPAALAHADIPPSSFTPITPQKTDRIVLPDDYTYDLVARWGDSLFKGTPGLKGEDVRSGGLLDPAAAKRQERQFGANCDAVAYFPVSGRRSDRGTLCVNNEYVMPEHMFRGRKLLGRESTEELQRWNQQNPAAVDLMKAAQGVSVLGVVRRRGAWQLQRGAPQSRRITAETVCEIAGPARGSVLMRTREDPTGTHVRGTFANCAGGKTPWDTYLTAEENIDDYFGSARRWAASTDDKLTVEAHRRFPLRDGSLYGWDHVDTRFDVRHEPREALRFGWIVEIGPRNPSAAPRKRTALGRFSHEGANTRLCGDGRVAVYMGDDDMFEYVYKFVTRGKFDPRKPEANRDLLDEGTLYVARFEADGTGSWLPLVYDEKGPLNRAAGFESQADVVIRARAAADLVGATPMDRPEDVEPCPFTGRLYIACTRNKERVAGSRQIEWAGRVIDIGVNAANPRAANEFGHIIEISEEDSAVTQFVWNVFLLADVPRAPGRETPIACPDNLGIDRFGRLWIVTDTDNDAVPNNGCFVCPTTGPERGKLRQLMSAPMGAEVCGCEFTPDGTTLFLSIQHPGEGGTMEQPVSHWPEGGDLPPRASLIAVRRKDGQPV